MFPQFKKRIFLIQLIAIILCYLMINMFCFKTVFSNILSNYQNLLQKYITSLCTRTDSTLLLIEETASLIPENNLIINSLNSCTFNPAIIDYLNGLSTFSPAIQGISIYHRNLDYPLYSTSLISNPPSLKNLYENNYFNTLTQNPASCWVVRYKELDRFYDFSKYNKTSGLLSYFSPLVSSDKKILGYLIIDVNIPELLIPYKPHNNNFITDLSPYIVLHDGTTIPSEALSFPKTSFKNTFTYTYPLATNAHLKIDLSLDKIYIKFGYIKAFLSLLFIVTSIFFIFLTKYLTTKIVVPLENLHTKINHFFKTL